MLRIVRQGIDRLVAFADADRLVNNDLFAFGLLFGNAASFKCFEILIAAAVKARHLGTVYFNYKVVYLKGAYRGQTMFQGLDAHRTFFYRRTAVSFSNVSRDGLDPYRLGHIRAHKDHSGVHLARTKHNFCVFAGKKAPARKLCLTVYCLLQPQVFLLSLQVLSAFLTS